MINYVDNFLTKIEQQRVFSYCLKAPYFYGETDNGEEEHPVTGMVSDIARDHWITKLLTRRCEETFAFLKDREMYRININIFAPNERAYYHIDRTGGYTLLYYPNLEWKLDNGGATEFNLEGQLQGIHPVPNRLAIFDANILHRATPFTDRHRFTIAIKYE